MGRDKNEGDLDVNINEGGPYSDAGVGPNQDTTSFDHRRNTPEPAYLVEEEPNARPASGEETIGIETSPLPKEMLSRAELGRQGRTIQPTKTSTSRLTPMTWTAVVIFVILVLGATTVWQTWRRPAVSDQAMVEPPAPKAETIDGVRVRSGLQGNGAGTAAPPATDSDRAVNLVPSGDRVTDPSSQPSEPTAEDTKPDAE